MKLILIFLNTAFAHAEEFLTPIQRRAYERPTFVSDVGDLFRKNVNSAATFVLATQLEPDQKAILKNDKIKFREKLIRDEFNLCDDDPYAKEKNYGGGFCSGCAVAPDLILTAKHCINRDISCKSMKIIFGLQEGTVKKEDVFECAELIEFESNHKSDVALVRLNKSITDRLPTFEIGKNYSKKLKVGDSLFTIGNPWGMRQTISIGEVKEFRINHLSIPEEEGLNVIGSTMPSFHGNSGGCVFNKETKALEGVLSDGYQRDVEWDYKKNCNRIIPASKMSKKVTYTYIVPISAFLDPLNKEIEKSFKRFPRPGHEKRSSKESLGKN